MSGCWHAIYALIGIPPVTDFYHDLTCQWGEGGDGWGGRGGGDGEKGGEEEWERKKEEGGGSGEMKE